MHFFKFAVSFLAVGGATYALIKINEAPPWLIAATLAMAIAALITSLPYLPQAIDAIESAAKKIAAMVPATPPPARPPVRQEPSTPRYEPPQPAPEYRPPRIETPPPPQPKCAALVMSNQGGWGGSSGRGLTCAERLERARSSCGAHTSGQCGNYAAGPWVAGIHCGIRMAHGVRRNSFAGYGTTEEAAFARAYQHASAQGFPPQSCKRRVALSADEAAPRRYD
jgi:hypothetical protein